jgi:hypothetical protein
VCPQPANHRTTKFVRRPASGSLAVRGVLGWVISGQAGAIELLLEAWPTAVRLLELGDELVNSGRLGRPAGQLAHLCQPTSGDPVMLRAGLRQFVVDEPGEDRQHSDRVDNPRDRPARPHLERLEATIPRLLHHPTSQQRRHRSDQRHHRTPPPDRPRLQEPSQLPTTNDLGRREAHPPESPMSR